MKNTMKRLLCLLLALCMCAGLALGAAAAGEEKEETIIGGDDGNSEGGQNTGDEGGDKDDEDKEVYASKFDPFSQSTIKVYLGSEPTVLRPNVQPADYNMGITWKSDNPDVADVDDDGSVTAKSKGNAKITATVKGSDGKEISQSCTVTVSENSVESITIRSADESNTIEGKGSLQLHAYARYTDGSDALLDDVDWSSSSTAIATVTSDGLVESTGAGKANITAKAKNGKTAVFVINVTAPSLVVSGSGIKGSDGKYTLSMSNGGTVKLSAEVQPKNTFTELGDITWESKNPTIASVDNGTVKALSNGTATINLKCGTLTATVTVTVGNATADISKSTTRSSDLTFSGVYSDLVDKFTAAYSKPSDSATFRFGKLGSATYGTLYTTSSANTKVTANKDYNLSNVKSMYFVPGSVGSYDMTYTLICDGHTLTGKITVTVNGSKSKDITIRLKDDSPYAFNKNTTTDKTYATDTIKKAISDASGLTYSYIVFKSPGSTSSKVGTLYPDSTKKYILSDYNSYTVGSTNNRLQSPVASLYFEPKKEGTYSIPYTAYDSSDNELCSGDLIIEVGVTDSAAVTVTLDDDGSYTFSTKTKKDKISAATAIDEAIKDETGKTYSYIKLGSVVSGSSVGTLYADDDKTAIKTTTKYSRSASASYSVSDLFFVPEKAGAYVRSFTAYDSNDKELLEGTLKLVVPGEGEGGMDIYFNTTTGSSVSMSENVFESWYRQQKGTNYKLAYVTFDGGGRGFGSFKSGSSAFTPGNEVKYYARGYTGSVGSSPKYLDKVSFTAPGYTGYVSVDFTCYGGTSASASGAKASGTFFIFVTKGSIRSVTCNVKYGSAVKLNEGDFASVYKNAMSLSSGASTRYYIKLLEIPSKGTLYYNYTSASKPGTKLTGSNFDDYEFYVNAASSYDSVSDLTYVPANSSSGAVSVRYLARSASGESMYVGSVSFNYGKTQGASVSCSSDGYAFGASDFYSGSDADPVAYVSFTQPEFGELMLGYANGRGIPLDSSVRLYTTDRANGSYPLSSLSYIPKAGFSGNVEISYTAVTESGKVQDGVMTVAVTGRKGSAHFRDVKSTGSGAWASDAIDYAYKWGLVNGTGEDTFSPDDTMTRAMLVTILYRSAGSPSVSGSCPFSDVASGAYYYYPVLWAAKNGIVTGTSTTTFSPDRDVNREQVAAFLHRYAKYNGENVTVTGTLNGYSDKSFVSQYAIEPMSWAVQHGYITSASGTSELLLSPGGNATRAQVAVMLHRFLTY